jgi:c-di-GMP-binding flagellar brake protein YcgR
LNHAVVSTQGEHPHERRQFRAAIAFPVTLIVPGHELVLDGEALDVSRGGMRVATTTDLPAGQPIMLRFSLPNSNDELLVHAKVVLSFFDAAKRTYAHGIAFTQYKAGDQELLTHFMSEIESKQSKAPKT